MGKTILNFVVMFNLVGEIYETHLQQLCEEQNRAKSLTSLVFKNSLNYLYCLWSFKLVC